MTKKIYGNLLVEFKNLGTLPLPIAGLLSSKPLENVVENFTKLKNDAKTLGELPIEPFALLSFLGLAVIPELRLTDKGYVDLTEFES